MGQLEVSRGERIWGAGPQAWVWSLWLPPCGIGCLRRNQPGLGWSEGVFAKGQQEGVGNEGCGGVGRGNGQATGDSVGAEPGLPFPARTAQGAACPPSSPPSSLARA